MAFCSIYDPKFCLYVKWGKMSFCSILIEVPFSFKLRTDVVVFMRMVHIGSHIWMFGPQLVELFGKDLRCGLVDGHV